MSNGIDDSVIWDALELAVRAPSIHNTQPWRFRLAPGAIEVRADRSRQLSATDPHGRDLMISCGCVLHHLLVALAAAGRRTVVRRLPNREDPDLVAVVEHSPAPPGTTPEAELAEVIRRRRTDRRRMRSWPVPPEVIGEMIELADSHGLTLTPITDPWLRWRLARAIAIAAEMQERDPAYAAEIATWTGRTDSVDGVPAANAPEPQAAPGRVPMRSFAHHTLADATDDEPENAALLLLSTTTDSPLEWLRTGEVTSAILLTATREGLASSPLTQPLEVDDTRSIVQERVLGSVWTHPQILLRLGWPRADAEELPPTPRRPLSEVVESTEPSR